MSIEKNAKRDRPVLIFGVLALLLIFSVIGYNLGKDRQQRVHSDQTAQDHAKNAEKYVERSCIGIIEALLLLECVNEAKKSANEQQRAQYDLDAQQQMARYAFLLFGLTAISTLITGLGVYYVRNTLLDSAKATSEMAETNRIMLEEQRPWIKIHDFNVKYKLIDGKIDAHYELRFENAGKSPAINVSYLIVPIPFQVDDWSESISFVSNVRVSEDENFEAVETILHGTSREVTLIAKDDKSCVKVEDTEESYVFKFNPVIIRVRYFGMASPDERISVCTFTRQTSERWPAPKGKVRYMKSVGKDTYF